MECVSRNESHRKKMGPTVKSGSRLDKKGHIVKKWVTFRKKVSHCEKGVTFGNGHTAKYGIYLKNESLCKEMVTL